MKRPTRMHIFSVEYSDKLRYCRTCKSQHLNAKCPKCGKVNAAAPRRRMEMVYSDRGGIDKMQPRKWKD